jgi:hypothetical protein
MSKHTRKEREKYIQTEGELFEKVQLSLIFPDSKTFVDSYPVKNPKDILKTFHKKKIHLISI